MFAGLLRDHHGAPETVVVSSKLTAEKRSFLEHFGASIIVVGSQTIEVNRHCRELLAAPGGELHSTFHRGLAGRDISHPTRNLSRRSSMNHDEEDDRTYDVVMNHEEQYSIWLKGREIPAGWTAVGKSGLKAECLDYIEQVWTDMRPLSLRKHMEAFEAQQAAEGPSTTAANTA